MKTGSFFAVAVYFGSAILAHPLVAGDIPTPSHIDAVKVYQGSAEITRIGTVSVPAGAHEIVFRGLSSKLETKSLHHVFGSDLISIRGLDLMLIQEAESVARRERELNATLEALRSQRAGLVDAVATSELQLTFLENMSRGYGEKAFRESLSGNAAPGNWTAALEFLGSGGEAARGTIRDSRAGLREVDRKIDLVQRQFNDVRAGIRSSYELHVSVFAERDLTTTAAFSYLIDDANWAPAYRLRLDSDNAQVTLTRLAEVTQNTGNEWTDVALTLATGQPSDGVEAPQLPPVFLSLRDPEPRFEMAAIRGRSNTGEERLEEVVLTGSRMSRIRVGVSEFSVQYAIPDRVTLGSHTATKTFQIAETILPVEVMLRVVPRLDETAYLVARHSWRGGDFLLPGAALIYRDNEYVGAGDLDLIRPGDEAVFPLGSDPLVQVTHATDGGARSDKGFLGHDNARQYLFATKITNRHDRDMKFEIIDRLPVAGDEDIKVTVLDSATPADEVSPPGKPGLVYWRPTVAANGTVTIRHHYELRYPKDKELVRRPGNQ